MGSQITAYAYTVISLLVGSGLCAFAFGFRVAAKVAVVWLLLLTTAYFTNIAVLFAVVVAFVVFIKNEPPEAKLFYFVSLIPALPLQSFFIPFPGINYLWDINFIRMLILVLFVPMLLEYLSRPPEYKKRLCSTDIYFFAFVFLLGIMAIRTGNVTFTLREMFGVFVDIGLPYFVISRFLTNTQALNWLFCGFLMSAVFICLFSLFETLSAWRFFGEVLFSLNVQFEWLTLVPYVRGGFVRAAGGPMFQPLAFGYFASLAIVTCFFFWQKKVLRFMPAAALMGLYFVALYLTNSKGGLLAMMLGISILFYLKVNSFVRFLINIFVIVVVPITVVYFVSTGFSTINDSEDSFSYRYQLILNSLNAVSNNPVFGSIDFLNDPYLQQSIQGEGIIDVVNLYLQVLLEYGFVGLFLYVMIFASLIKRVLKKTSVVGFDHKHLLLALLGMTMFFIFTCSDISFIPWYVLLWWSLSRAYIGFEEAAAAKVASASAVSRKSEH